jgi:selenide,water dikinase
MAEHSSVRLHIYSQQVPLLPGARSYAEKWLFPGGANRNREYFEKWVTAAKDVPEELLMLLYTPETSGGLLIAVPQGKLARVKAFLHTAAQAYWLIGEIEAGTGIQVH